MKHDEYHRQFAEGIIECGTTLGGRSFTVRLFGFQNRRKRTRCVRQLRAEG